MIPSLKEKLKNFWYNVANIYSFFSIKNFKNVRFFDFAWNNKENNFKRIMCKICHGNLKNGEIYRVCVFNISNTHSIKSHFTRLLYPLEPPPPCFIVVQNPSQALTNGFKKKLLEEKSHSKCRAAPIARAFLVTFGCLWQSAVCLMIRYKRFIAWCKGSWNTDLWGQSL